MNVTSEFEKIPKSKKNYNRHDIKSGLVPATMAEYLAQNPDTQLPEFPVDPDRFWFRTSSFAPETAVRPRTRKSRIGNLALVVLFCVVVGGFLFGCLIWAALAGAQ